MLKGRTSKLLEIPNIPSEYKDRIKRLKLSNEFFPQYLISSTPTLNFSVYPNGKPCFFFYNEENEVLVFSFTYTLVFMEKTKINFQIGVLYPKYFRCFTLFNFTLFNFTLDEKSKKAEINFLSSKSNTILLKAVKLISDVDKMLIFLENSVERIL